MSRRMKRNNQHHKLIEESKAFSDDYLTRLLKKAEIVINSIKPTGLHYGKE